MFWNRDQVIKLKAGLERAHSKINELEARCNSLHTVLESMVEGVIIVDKDTMIISVNSSSEKIFGISKKETEGSFFLEAVRNNDMSEVINAVLNEAKFISQELDLVWPIQGTFQVNASPIFENDKINGCLLVIHDVTEIRKLETMRKDFLANASHELKTPLTSIKGFVETLLEGALEDKTNAGHFLKIISEHVNRLDNLINDLLSLSYLESKEITLQKSQVDARELAEDIISGFKSQLKKRSIQLKNDLSNGLCVKADREKIGQVFTNLIDNAVKFNRENGSVNIYDEVCADMTKFIIEDTGMGIPEKDIPRIFERFYRVDKARSRELGGTGLGLSIVKHIVELHGGTVGVESTEGAGSKFFFILPN